MSPPASSREPASTTRRAITSANHDPCATSCRLHRAVGAPARPGRTRRKTRLNRWSCASQRKTRGRRYEESTDISEEVPRGVGGGGRKHSTGDGSNKSSPNKINRVNVRRDPVVIRLDEPRQGARTASR